LFAALSLLFLLQLRDGFRPSISLTAVRDSHKLNVVVFSCALLVVITVLYGMFRFLKQVYLFLCIETTFYTGCVFAVSLCTAAVTGCRGWCGLTMRCRCRARGQDKRDTV